MNTCPQSEEDPDRLVLFERVCPGEFRRPLDRSQLKNPGAFEQVAHWNGRYPGPLGVGLTGTAKTRAAWVALRRLFVCSQVPSFRWYIASDLLQRYADARGSGNQLYFLRGGSGAYAAPLFIDDLDKINFAFDSETSNLFAIYDAIYRENIPCLATTNQTKAWWAHKMGAHFTRRLFEGAHQVVQF